MDNIKCEVMKSNQMQCSNPAFVTINGISTCRLDLNWYINRIIDGTLLLSDADIKAIEDADTVEVNKLLTFAGAAAVEARAAK